MDASPTPVMTFANIDEAESALDWIGVDFAEADGAFEGVLTADDIELLDEVDGDPDTPEPVRALSAALRGLLGAPGREARAAWRVEFGV